MLGVCFLHSAVSVNTPHHKCVIPAWSRIKPGRNDNSMRRLTAKIVHLRSDRNRVMQCLHSGRSHESSGSKRFFSRYKIQEFGRRRHVVEVDAGNSS